MDEGTFDRIVVVIKKKGLTELQKAELMKTAENNIEDNSADAHENISLLDTSVEELTSVYPHETE